MPHIVYCSVSGDSSCADPDGKGRRKDRGPGMKFRPVPLWLLAVLSAGVIGLGYVAPKDDQPAMMCNSCRLVAESRRGTFKQTKKCCCVSGCSFSQRSFVASNPTPLYFVQPDPIEKQRGRELLRSQAEPRRRAISRPHWRLRRPHWSACGRLQASAPCSVSTLETMS